MKLSSTIAFLILLAQVIALPFLHLRRATNNIRAEIDPQIAPKTAQNIRDFVTRHGAEKLTVRIRDLNDHRTAQVRREEAIADKCVPGMEVDEEPPASFRKPGDPVTTAVVTVDEGRHQAGVLGRAVRAAHRMGPGTTITHGIKGENLANYERPPADAAKARHRNGGHQKRGAIWLKYLKGIAAL